MGRPPLTIACSQTRLIILVGGGAGGGIGGRKSGKGGGKCAGSGIPQGGGRREKQETVTHTQHRLRTVRPNKDVILERL